MEQLPYFNQVPKPKVEPYTESKFLQYEGHQEDVYEASLSLANYLKAEKIKNVMFLDNSARQAYVGLKEAWKEVGDGDPLSSIYFMNPGELKYEDDTTRYKDEFLRTYKHLNHEDSILLYDACIHSGDTLFATKEFFIDLGFTDVKLAVTSTDKSFAKEKEKDLDLICLDHRARAGCRPFGRPMYVGEKPGSIVSQRVDSRMQHERGDMEHKRIKDVFKK